ncbi:hypothetical protein, partial [Shouchella clausii]|uniref:hypothetical protein n=1 Tax=Shouchella clausii TaxID=79880 RepID=UPI001C3E8961
MKFNDKDTYGLISCTKRTNNLYTSGMTGILSKTFIPSTVEFDNFAPLGDSDGAKSTRRMNASGFGAT